MHFLTELGAKKVEASLIYLRVPFYSITTCLPGAQVSCFLKLIIDTAFILNMTNSFNQMAVQIALFYFFFSICFLGLLFVFIMGFYHHMSIFYTF